MNRTIKIFRPCFFIEIILGLIGSATLIYYRPDDIANIVVVMFIYLSVLTSLIIGMRLAIATQNKLRLSDELNIVGHIANVIKLLAVIIVLAAAIYFFSLSIKAVTVFSTMGLIYYTVLFSFFVWGIVSVFNFFAYIVIAKMNKRIRFEEVDTIGLNS